jgi:methanogenic corrinoid protein MtbC1
VAKGGPSRAARAGKLLSLPEAAKMSGLHYMTLYRHVRTARLPATQSRGRWWVQPAALATLSNRARPGRRPSSERWQQVSKSLQARMLVGDARGAWQLVEATLARGASPAQVYLDALSPALRDIGTRWACGRLTVQAEHVATAVAIRVMGQLGPHFNPRGSRTLGLVVVGGAPGDPHLLPVAMVADLLRSFHLRVLDLGANVPEDAFVQAASSTEDLMAVGISLSDANCAPGAARCLAGVRAARPGVLLLAGGPAVATKQDALSLGADDWAADGLSAAELVRQAAR